MHVDWRAAMRNARVRRYFTRGDGGAQGVADVDFGGVFAMIADVPTIAGTRVRRMVWISHPGQEMWTGLKLSCRSVDIAGDITKGL